MRMELLAEGKVITIVSEGYVSVQVREAVPSAAVLGQARNDEAAPVNRENELFLKLAGIRRELAAAASVPPYVVFNDKTLREIVQRRPQTLAQLEDIPGVGRVKLEKYGEMFLAAINGEAD